MTLIVERRSGLPLIEGDSSRFDVIQPTEPPPQPEPWAASMTPQGLVGLNLI